MNNFEKILITITVIFLVALAALSLRPTTQKNVGDAGSYQAQNWQTTLVAVASSTPGLLVAGQPQRQTLEIVNTSTVGVWLSSVTTSPATGVYLAPGTTKIYNENNPYTGIIYAITSWTVPTILNVNLYY